MIIYKITNKINYKIYVGQTTRDMMVRWKEHCKDKRACKALFSAINKYGKHNFIIEILEICNNIAEMNEKEFFYIKSLNSMAPNGYNLRTGGMNSLMSEIPKNKMSESHLGEKNFNFKKPMKDDTKKKISFSKIGKKYSESFKKKRSDYMKLFNPQFNMNEEKLKRLLNYNNKKKCKVLCVENGHIYFSISEAARILNISKGNIANVLSGKYLQTNGYTFKRIA